MKQELNAYIDKYIKDAAEPDKKVARHLKEISPKPPTWMEIYLMKSLKR